MNRKEVENMINNIDEKYVQEAGEYVLKNQKKRTNRSIKHVATIAAAFALCFIVSVPVLSAAGVQPAFDILYSAFPKVAQKLKPVNLSCEDNGIKIEVVSANVHDNVADIYISMQDLTGDRINETIDLFDSYYIKPAYDSVGNCELVDYNDTTKTATFLIRISQFDNQKISGEKITFSLNCFLSDKQEYNKALSDTILKNVKKNPVTQSDVNIRGGAGLGVESDAESLENIKNFLKVDEKNNYSPVEGVTITAAGFIDEKLHIQVYYEDILKTDNHGEVYLIDSKNNIINYKYNYSFWDEKECGSYEEYIFDISPETDLENYTLYGDFTVCSSLTEGDWKVTFPLENIK